MSEATCEECGSNRLVHNEHTHCKSCHATLGGYQYEGDHFRKEIRELIEQWRDEAESLDPQSSWNVRHCADELEDLL